MASHGGNLDDYESHCQRSLPSTLWKSFCTNLAQRGWGSLPLTNFNFPEGASCPFSFILLPKGQDLAEELPHLRLAGVFEQLGGRGAFQNLPFCDEGDGVCDGAGETHFVGAEDDLLSSVD